MAAALQSRLTKKKNDALCALLGKVNLTLLYKASVHGYHAADFHQECDFQGPTLLVAYNNTGYIFGGYTSVDYAQSYDNIKDDKAFLFSFQGDVPLCIKPHTNKPLHPVFRSRSLVNNGASTFGQQLIFCYNNQPLVYNQNTNSVFNINPATLYGNDTNLIECEVYKVEPKKDAQNHDAKIKPWRTVQWSEKRREELLKAIRSYKPLMSSINRIRILMIGPVGAGKSSFFNSINSIFLGRISSKAMSGSAGTSLTTQFRIYSVKDGREGKPLPFELCDTMGLEENSGAGLDIEDITGILRGHIPDRYKFNPSDPFQPVDQKPPRAPSLQEKIHCVVYVVDSTKVSLMSEKLEAKLAAIRKKINSLGIPQMVLMSKVDEACPDVQEDLQKIYTASYIKTKVRDGHMKRSIRSQTQMFFSDNDHLATDARGEFSPGFAVDLCATGEELQPGAGAGSQQ
ncbi:hypothetical protein DNTS_026425 [Danionella cerebrum]|uniref:TLDc domain-containing protein n=1 Tax=Danionella cerebrum TaxID=2873325 RepID=A0A553RKW8_9TELE|nr:hypothetical protein DNTS_026425 [Danionella translucida]